MRIRLAAAAVALAAAGALAACGSSGEGGSPATSGAAPQGPITTLPLPPPPTTLPHRTTVPSTSTTVGSTTTSTATTTPRPTTAPATIPLVTSAGTTPAPIVINGLTLARCISVERLRVGDRSAPRDEVALYQHTLDVLGFDPGDVDGYFGQNTLDAAADEIRANAPEPDDELRLTERTVGEATFARLGLDC